MRTLVGRDDVLADLQAAVARAGNGQGSVALVRGEAGIGKTAVVEEVARSAAEQGIRVRWASCWDGDGAPPFWPWVQILRSHLDDTATAGMGEATPPEAADIDRLLPGDGSVEGRVGEPSTDERFRLFDSIASLLARTSRAPTLVVVDDVHLADSSSIELLRFLRTRIHGCRSPTTWSSPSTSSTTRSTLPGCSRPSTLRCARTAATSA